MDLITFTFSENSNYGLESLMRNKDKTLLVAVNKLWKQTVCWHHKAMFCLITLSKLSCQWFEFSLIGWDWIRAIFLNLFYFKAHSGGQIRENSSFEEQKQPLTSGSSAFNQANQQTGNVATSSTSGQTASEAANAPPPPFLPPSHIQSSQQNNFQQAAVCFRVSRVIEFSTFGDQN